MLACSGGADSVALVLIASSMPRAGDRFVVAYVRHDLRPAAETQRELELVRDLAERAGMGFENREVVVARDGSVEAAARTVRYEALAEIAESSGCDAVLTAHHADDQAETVLLRLMRGAGPAGVSGMREQRTLRGQIELLRPALGVPRETLRSVCAAAGERWLEDRTNREDRFERNALRQHVMPELEAIRRGSVASIASSALAAQRAADAIAELAQRLVDEGRDGGAGFAWERSVLAWQPVWIRSETARLAVAATGEEAAVGKDLLLDIAHAIGDESTEPRMWKIGGTEVKLSARRLTVGAAGIA